MKKYIQFIAVVFFVVGMVACTKVLPYEEGFEPKLTLFGSMSLESDTHYFMLGQTTSPLEDDWYSHSGDYEPLLDATFILRKNGVSQSISYQVTGKSGSLSEYMLISQPLNVKVGDELTIEVDHPGFTTIKSTTNGIKTITIPVTKKGEEGISEGNWYTFNEFMIEFQDPPGKGDYYLIDAKSFHVRTKDVQLQQSLPKGFLNEDSYYNFYDVETISDEFFDGQQVSWSMEMEEYDYNKVWDNPVYRSGNKLRLTKITKAEYDYYRAVKLQDYSDPMFSEPVVVPSNIENGVGLFGVNRSFDLNKPL